MIDTATEGRRRAFSVWLRTGRRPTMRPDGVELKFNPYHDPRNGQFTFAPGGPRSLDNVVISDRRRARLADKPTSMPEGSRSIETLSATTTAQVAKPPLKDAVYRPSETEARPQKTAFARNPRASRGGNSRAFNDPVVLAQVFPGLQTSPDGAIIALADNALDLHGPQLEATAALTLNHSNMLIEQIKAIDPQYRFDSLGFPATLQGQINQINDLRWERAAALVRVRGELRPLQVETMRFVQERTDRAYEQGLAYLRAGKLKTRLSEPEALGNFIDREVRRDLREHYKKYGIESAGSGPVRVNRRENNTSATDTTYRRPDARVGAIAYDVTLTRKTLGTAQVRGFFSTDFRPGYVIIIRPRQLGPGSSYIIKRPEPRR